MQFDSFFWLLVMIKQRSIIHSVSARGNGIHSGKQVLMNLLPAPIDHGVIFKRLDLNGKTIKAQSAFVNEVVLSTGLEEDGTKVSTVEHLLSALSALGIDNIIVELDSFEVPIMDGSSAHFIFLIQAAGIVEQDAYKKFFVIKEPIRVEHNDSWAELLPYFGFKVSLEINFYHKLIKDSGQKLSFDFSEESYLKEISRARTFGLIKDLKELQKNGKALGASLENAIALDDDNILNTDGMRYSNEFVKHKILDIIGDLYLLGNSVVGEYKGYKTGHYINNKLLTKLLNNSNSWGIKEFEEQDTPIIFYSDDYWQKNFI